MLELLSDPQTWMAFATLTALELVLGIDNVIFISILVDRLPREQREKARRIGLFLAMFMRVALLVLLAWMVGMTKPLFALFDIAFSGRDLILIAGGFFLVWKSTHEVHQLLEGVEGESSSGVGASFMAIVSQIIIIDLVFSLDSIITAVGMVREVEIMIAAVVASVALMMLYARVIGDFVSEHPTIKMLALSFLMVVGVTLIVEGFGYHVPKGYIYFAMAFSVGVEVLNIRMRKKRGAESPVKLHEAYSASQDAPK